MNGRRTLEWLVVLLLAMFAFVNALSWASVIPPGEAPDEPGHYEVVAFEAVFHRIPEFAVDDYGAAARRAQDGYNSPYFAYSAQPGLSYILSAAAIELLGSRLVDPVMGARCPGALWAALMTIVTFLGARAMFGERPGVAVLAATLVSCWPQLALVFSYVNNDGLTALVCAALIATWYLGRESTWKNRHVVWLGILCGLTLLGKPNGFLLVGIAAVVLLSSGEAAWTKRVSRTTLAGVVATAVGGWWYVLAYSRYGWDLFASLRAEEMRLALGVEWASGRRSGLGFIETAYGYFPRYGEPWILGTLRSAVGVLGEMTVHLHWWSYALAGCLTVFAIAGATYGWAARDRRRIDFVHCATYLLIPAMVVLSLYRSWGFDYQAQGRYLFPAMLPYAAGIAFGSLAPFQGVARGIVGFVITISLVSLMMDAFMVRLLRLYDMTFGDFFVQSPPLAVLWVATMLAALTALVLYWLRLGNETSKGEGVGGFRNKALSGDVTAPR